MINTLVTTVADAGTLPLNELLNVAHNRPFSLLFGNYSWLLGMAGGVALVWAFDAISRGFRSNSDPVFQLAMPLCFVLIVGGFLNVLGELPQPSRLIFGYIQGWNYWDTAIIKYGIILLPLFLVSSWWLSFQCINKETFNKGMNKLPGKLVPLAEFLTLWSRHYNICDYPVLSRIVVATMIVFGLFAPLYSAIFLMYEHGVPVWNSPAQALIFLATSVAKGAAIFMVFAPLLYRFATGKHIKAPDGVLRWLAVAGLIVSAVTWFGWMWWMGRLGTIPDQRFTALINGPYHDIVLWHWEIIGLIIPLLLLSTPLGKIPGSRLLAGIAILWGSYAIRIIILLGGQALNRSGAGYLTFGLEPGVIWYSVFSLIFMLGLLALMLLLPYGHNESTKPSAIGEK